MEKKIMIIGAGPTGLGAGYTLHKMGYRNWEIHEKQSGVGGLSSSVVDRNGFTWDLGGHVLFTRSRMFKNIVASAMGGCLNTHRRDAWIHMRNRWIPYPLQNNLRYLPIWMILECLLGRFQAANCKRSAGNFAQWIQSTFGKGIARHFMIPYNKKVWTCHPETMGHGWIADRVSVVDMRSILGHVFLGDNGRAWGPNNTFQYPSCGGIGAIFSNLAAPLRNHLLTGSEVEWIDPHAKTIGFRAGERRSYDCLINTMPIDALVGKINGAPEAVKSSAKSLRHNRVMVVGIGFRRKDPTPKSWVYFPERVHPYYRVTYLSNYADDNVPDIRNNFSLMAEIASSPENPTPTFNAVQSVLIGFEAAGMTSLADRERILSTFTHEIDYAYPIPTLDRDMHLETIHAYLEDNEIYSRGRFGAWMYEHGNMDHSFLQGCQAVERLLLGRPEHLVKRGG